MPGGLDNHFRSCPPSINVWTKTPSDILIAVTHQRPNDVLCFQFLVSLLHFASSFRLLIVVDLPSHSKKTCRQFERSRNYKNNTRKKMEVLRTLTENRKEELKLRQQLQQLQLQSQMQKRRHQQKEHQNQSSVPAPIGQVPQRRLHQRKTLLRSKRHRRWIEQEHRLR